MIPEHARPTSRKFEIDGVEFQTHRTGVAQYTTYGLDGRLIVQRNYHRSTYFASICLQDEWRCIGRRFTTERAACRAAVRADYDIKYRAKRLEIMSRK